MNDSASAELEIIHAHLRLAVACLGHAQAAVRTVLLVLQHMPNDQQVLHRQRAKEGRDASVG
jgi:hypothetical protein